MKEIAPVLLPMLGFARLVIHLVDSAEPVPAVEMLRGRLSGAILEVISRLWNSFFSAAEGEGLDRGRGAGGGVFVLGGLFVLPWIGIIAMDASLGGSTIIRVVGIRVVVALVVHRIGF